jgi:hypothetical protein
MNISKIISPNPEVLKISDNEFIARLNRGFYLYEPTKYPNGILVRTLIKELADGHHEAHCRIFMPTSQNHQGTTLEMIKLGYLTHESLKHVTRHQHDGCTTELEIHCG